MYFRPNLKLNFCVSKFRESKKLFSEIYSNWILFLNTYEAKFKVQNLIFSRISASPTLVLETLVGKSRFKEGLAAFLDISMYIFLSFISPWHNETKMLFCFQQFSDHSGSKVALLYLLAKNFVRSRNDWRALWELESRYVLSATETAATQMGPIQNPSSDSLRKVRQGLR